MTVTLLTVVSLSLSGAIDLDELANAAGRPIGRGEIQRITFDESLVFAWQWGGPGDAKGTFAFPLDAAVDLDGNVYVTDHENWRVQKFTASGDFVAEIRASGKPWGAAIDRAGNLFVIVNPISEGWSATYRGTLIKYDRRGTRTSWAAKGPDGRLPDGWDPRGIATDRDGNVYVANADDGARDVKK